MVSRSRHVTGSLELAQTSPLVKLKSAAQLLQDRIFPGMFFII